MIMQKAIKVFRNFSNVILQLDNNNQFYGNQLRYVDILRIKIVFYCQEF